MTHKSFKWLEFWTASSPLAHHYCSQSGAWPFNQTPCWQEANQGFLMVLSKRYLWSLFCEKEFWRSFIVDNSQLNLFLKKKQTAKSHGGGVRCHLQHFLRTNKRLQWKVKSLRLNHGCQGPVGNMETSEVQSFCKCLNCFPPPHTLSCVCATPATLNLLQSGINGCHCNPKERAHAFHLITHRQPLARALLFPL